MSEQNFVGSPEQRLAWVREQMERRQRRDRIITCVNACQGIPSDLLAGDGLLHMAIQLMRRACDFGDIHLQTLPDRIAANMTDLYYGTILKERIADVRTELCREP